MLLWSCAKPPNNIDPHDEPLTQADIANVQAAIDALQQAGHVWHAKRAQKLLNSGKIIKNAKVGGCGSNWHPPGTNDMCNTIIRILPNYISMGDVQFLGGIIVHELDHTLYDGSAAGEDEEHCKVYYDQYRKYKQLSNPSPHVKAHIAQIEGWYTNFAGYYAMSGGSGFPPYVAPSALCLSQIAGNASACVAYTTEPGGVVAIVSTTSSVTTTTLSVPCDFITSIQLGEDYTGVAYLVVVGHNTVGTAGGVYIITDSDADDVVDSLSTISSAGASLQRPVHLCRNELNGSSLPQYFILDQGLGKIFGLQDTDADGKPNNLGGAIADLQLCPELATARSTSAASIFAIGNLDYLNALVVTNLDSSDDNLVSVDAWLRLIKDTNGDGAFDAASPTTSVISAVTHVPFFAGGGMNGQSLVRVWAPAGHVIRVHEWDSSSLSLGAQIGQATMPRLQTTMTIYTTEAFSDSKQYVLYDQTVGSTSPIATPEAEHPEVFSVTPCVGRSNVPTTVTVTGTGLSSQMTVMAGTAGATIITCTSTEMVVEVPAQPSMFGTVELTFSHGNTLVSDDWSFEYQPGS